MSSTTQRWQRNVQIYDSRLLSAPFIFWSVLAFLGITLSLGRLFTGLWFTGMNDDYAWGVWKTFNVMTLTALGSGGLAVGLFAFVLGRHRLHVVMRTALMSSLLFYATGMAALAIDVGRPWNMYHLFLPWNWNTHSSLFEVAICMTAYVVLFLSFENVPALLEREAITGDPERRAKVAVWTHRIRKVLPFIIAGAYVLPMMHQSSLGSLMVIAGHKVHPLWQTQMLPALYLIQAIVCGFAAVMFILMSASLAWRRPLDIPVLSEMGRYMSWMALGFVGLRYLDVIVRGVPGQAFQVTWYALLFHVENFMLLIPAVLLLNKRLQTIPRVLFVCATLVGVGGILYRFTPTTLAFRVSHPSVYFPKIAELLMCLGYIGLAVVLFIWAAKRFAILPGTNADWDAYVRWQQTSRTEEVKPKLRMEHGAATDY